MVRLQYLTVNSGSSFVRLRLFSREGLKKIWPRFNVRLAITSEIVMRTKKQNASDKQIVCMWKAHLRGMRIDGIE